MSVNLGETTASTLKNRHSEVVDNVSNHNRLLTELRKKGKWESHEGGRTIDCPIDYSANSNGKWFAGNQESFAVPEQDHLDAATFDWKFYGTFCSYTLAERTKNAGKHAAVRLMKSKINNLKRSVANTIAASLYSDGTTSLEIGGLQFLIDDDPTSAGTVGGIDQAAATGAFWRNYNSAAEATSASNIQSRMKTAWLNIIRGNDSPDLILADDDMFTYYWDSLSDLQRITTDEGGDVTQAEGLRFQKAKVFYDDQCPDKHMYFVNCDHMTFFYSPGHLFEVGDARDVDNAFYSVIPLTFVGNLATSRRASHGVIIAS